MKTTYTRDFIFAILNNAFLHEKIVSIAQGRCAIHSIIVVNVYIQGISSENPLTNADVHRESINTRKDLLGLLSGEDDARTFTTNVDPSVHVINHLSRDGISLWSKNGKEVEICRLFRDILVFLVDSPQHFPSTD
jgi:hypothetical protein